MKSPLNSKGQMVLLLDPNDPQQCAYTDTTVASWLQKCDGGRRIHDLCLQDASQSCLGGEGIPPCYWWCKKSISATPSKGRSFLKQAMSIPGSEEQMAGAPSHAVSGRPLLTVMKLKVAFAQRRGLSRRLRGSPVPALYHSVLEKGGKGWTRTN